MELRVMTKLVEALSADYQISGRMELLGNPGVYVNDDSYPTFTINDAVVTPLMVGTQVGPVSLEKVFLPKQEAQVLLMDMSLDEAQLLPTYHNLVVFTDTFVIRGKFITNPETGPQDVFSSGGPYFPAIEAEVHAIRPLTTEIGGFADMIYVKGNDVRAFYSKGH